VPVIVKSAPKPQAEVIREPAPAARPVPQASIAPSPITLEEPQSDFESSDSAPMIGVLEDPLPVRSSAVVQPAAPFVAAPEPQNFSQWVRNHKWSVVVAIVLAWIAFAGIQRLFHPMSLMRSTVEEMELRQKIKQAMTERAAELTGPSDAKNSDAKSSGANQSDAGVKHSESNSASQPAAK
jgi:hypothetical protein